MLRAIAVLALLVGPTNLDLPPEGVSAPAAAIADTPAERGPSWQETEPPAPPTTAAPSFANDCDEMHYYRAAVGLPARFDQIGWRESNCRQETGVRTSCCVGWWQLNVRLHLRDSRIAGRYHACGVYSESDANGPDDKARQACAARALYDVVGLSAWAATR